MRIQHRGGVWKNSEDEILKAAVMKYGKNQWPRIASLLVRKSATQCKARWFEWLDPSIKKTPWTREEEERLLHLAKILPNSWRTIAPMIGRTASQCLEHYEKLLDQANRPPEEQDHAASSSNAPNDAVPPAGVGRTHQGEIDSVPETKPARPDPVDMDEDELEMLNEARARLANTRGKKAKRKAREKQLESAKRLAQLQKRRELKAAGVDTKGRKKKKNVTDYATEIPFEREPVPGFYSTREEDERLDVEFGKKKQIGKLLQNYEGKSEEQVEQEARRKDDARRKKLENSNLPVALGIDRTGAAPKSPPLKKARLVLPEPQMSDIEIEKLAKNKLLAPERGGASSSNDAPNDTAAQHSLPSSGPQRTLGSSVASTPRTTGESWASMRKRQLETIVSLNSSDTPLRGGENTPLVGLGLDSGVTPAPSELRTPNPLSTPSIASNASLSETSASQIRRAQQKKMRMLRETVQNGLSTLPDPENEYQVDLDLVDATMKDNDYEKSKFAEDAEDELVRVQKQEEAKVRALESRILSSAAKKSLPIPKHVQTRETCESDAIAYIANRDHMALRILHCGQNTPQTRATMIADLGKLSSEDDLDVDVLGRAALLVSKEMDGDGEDASLMQDDILKALMAREHSDDYLMSADGSLKRAETDEERNIVQNRIKANAMAFVGAEKKQREKQCVLFRGYEKKLREAYANLEELSEQRAKERIQLACFEGLATKEAVALPIRIKEMREKLGVESQT